MTPHHARPALLGAGLAALAVLTGCTAPGSAGDDPAEVARLVLADAYEPEAFNPVAGHGETGASKVYDGLVRLAGGSGLPELEPALAAELPSADAAGTTWTVPLREGVRFSDGTTFGAEDVVATYRAVLDPVLASPIATNYAMVAEVTAPDPLTVQFRLAYPYAPFPTKLLLGIAPAEALATPGPAEESPLNTEPVGTGPYLLAERRGDRTVYTANPGYWDGEPEVGELVVVYVPDDNTRAQRMAGGEFDGTTLPPLLADTLAGTDGLTVVGHPSADTRSVSLPAGDPVTGDPAVRLALNHAVDRDAMVASILGGHGVPASTPVPEVLGDAFEPAATFDHDPDRARQLLDAAGWVPGPDGVRVRDGVRAEFTLMYFPEETLRRDLAQAFASDALAVGVEVDLEAVDRPQFRPRIPVDAGLLGGGDVPYDPDTLLYAALHSVYTRDGVGGPFDNPSDHVDPEVDAALDAGRRSSDPAVRTAAYRSVQREFVADPPAVVLVFLEHVYVVRDGGWTGAEEVLEPHSHGVSWGPWWNVREWRRAG
ncbi:ABC transporter substrate-binding protein [Modestobacter versicolor]|uniref:Peptide/nickel transport system substrate-binding protein n=1 Tax=Modestobacter versicolor TaxID=429133 RepID=A0A839Y0S8_9ACTN|nr:ABC transporter substrate-binding protein [Modestobacter versicolor]MBB3674856.1 peptide/nickel transport system substrate-binding protein [Modestobacter versicolor]